jgi:hypothetical protein
MTRWRSVAAYTTCAVLFSGGCAIEDVKPGATGGTGGAGGSTGGSLAGMGTGGTTAGSVASGGTVGAGTSSGGNAGVATGGALPGGTGGAVPTGGTGGADAGMSGAGPTGGTPPMGGMGGMGGSAGTQGGAPGGGGTGGMPEDLSPNAIVPGLDGFLWVGTCASAGTGLDCAINDDNNACPNTGSGVPYAMRGAFRRRTFNVMGTQGRNYRINFEVRGVTGGKNYTGGTRGPMATAFNEAAGVNNDGWYLGGTPTDSLWNTYEIRVAPAVMGQPNVYYTNGFPAGTGDGWHGTVAIKVIASFVVPGRGTVELVIHDSNCQGQQNCGPTGDTRTVCVQGPGPRSVDLAGMDPMPASFTQPYTQTNNLHPQWLLWDVETITVE